MFLTGCASSHVSVQSAHCVLNGASLSSSITNHSDKPLTQIEVVADFYNNYRFTRGIGGMSFSPVLDPGQTRTVNIPVDVPNGAQGEAMKCSVTRAVYGDDSVEGESLRRQ